MAPDPVRDRLEQLERRAGGASDLHLYAEAPMWDELVGLLTAAEGAARDLDADTVTDEPAAGLPGSDTARACTRLATALHGALAAVADRCGSLAAIAEESRLAVEGTDRRFAAAILGMGELR